MKLLQDILFKVDLVEVAGSTHIAIPVVCFDSRKSTKDALFIAVKGTQSDGHDYISQAIENGAVAIIAEVLPSQKPEHVTFIKVNDSSKALAVVAANYYDNPSDEIQLIAITGTNGKTSVATLLYDLFQSLGHKVGLDIYHSQ